MIVCFTVPANYPENFLTPMREWICADVALDSRGHCVALTGFNDARGVFHVHDSQGERREFDHGGWWMGYNVVDSPVVREIYCLLK